MPWSQSQRSQRTKEVVQEKGEVDLPTIVSRATSFTLRKLFVLYQLLFLIVARQADEGLLMSLRLESTKRST